MSSYASLSPVQLKEEAARLQKEYDALKAKGLKLDLSRGKPDNAQLRLSMGMLDCLNSKSDIVAEDGTCIANYGALAGIPEARRMMAEILELTPPEVFVGGNSSLNLMHDCINIAYMHGLVNSPMPWRKLPQVKFLCPSPGYDRHFAVTEHYDIDMIPVPMTAAGPDMDVVEKLVSTDPAVKGMWCIPKYSNPSGLTYSDETVRRLANLSPAAPDFTLFWDNAYIVHHLYPDDPDVLLSITGELKKAGKPNMALTFTSTSKVTFPGSGVAAIGASKENIDYLTGHFGLQTISFDKVNQMRHVRFFGGEYTLEEHMRRHAALLLPKFEAVLQILRDSFGGLGIASWDEPRGGYFISLDIMDGCAGRAVALCKQAGVIITPAGATFPYGRDPRDRNIRIAPTFAVLEDAKAAATLLCLCSKMACVEKLLAAAADKQAS